MKAKIVQENMRRFNPDFDRNEWNKNRALYERQVDQMIPLPNGTIWEHDDAWKLVLLGIAIPEDDECREAASMTEEEMTKSQEEYRKLQKGMATGMRQYDVKAKLQDEDLNEELGLNEDGMVN